MTERLESLNEVCEGVAGAKITLKNVIGHRPFLHQKCPYFLARCEARALRMQITLEEEERTEIF